MGNPVGTDHMKLNSTNLILGQLHLHPFIENLVRFSKRNKVQMNNGEICNYVTSAPRSDRHAEQRATAL